jgi:hypothetical protein
MVGAVVRAEQSKLFHLIFLYREEFTTKHGADEVEWHLTKEVDEVNNFDLPREGDVLAIFTPAPIRFRRLILSVGEFMTATAMSSIRWQICCLYVLPCILIYLHKRELIFPLSLDEASSPRTCV